MNIVNRLSIKNKTYLLVLLSVIVALVLSLVSSNGLNSLRLELTHLINSTKIERYTNKLILEEQRYRLNANGSVSNFRAANQSFENAIIYVDEINTILESISNSNEKHFLENELKNTRNAMDEYKALYLKGVSLLTELNALANNLETEGEQVTMHIQHYVEEKRVEINDSLKQKTIDKINNGSNIWQYTYVIRLHEKKYRLSPDNAVFKLFKKDYKFMMLEWERLKGISDQQSEYQNLNEFKLSAVKYDHSMLLWVDLNNKLVSEVLPKMKALGNDVINSAVLSAKRSVNHMKEKHTNTTVTLLVVSVITIFLGVVFGSMIARSISGVVTTLQNGLINFFEYLNQKQKVAYPIEVHGNDEVSIMADVINKNIIKIQDLLNRKADYQQALLEWSRVDYQDESITIQKATELSAKALHVERVSIWLFNHDRTVLRCADIFLSKSSVHENGDVMIAEKYPQYFENIGDREMLISNQVRSDDRFEEFNNGYLEKHNIHSILDMAIIQDGILTGIIRHEKVGKVKSWQPDEQDFAKSVVSAISLSLEIKKRRVIQEELKAQKEMLHHHAHHDPLTGLPNRFLFNDRLNQVIKQARRNETKIAILFIDLDHFKGINDSMGHNVGDELLKEVASRLKQQIRQTDTLARLGGDEFSIVLNQVSDNDSVVEVTKSLLKSMELAINILDQSFYITLSIGVAIYPEDGTTSEELLKNSDAAMYQAKDDGRNTYEFYNQLMTEKAVERISLESGFRRALKNEEFIVHYQPQINAQTSQLTGMEALVRWVHPDMGLISPANFLPFADESGLIIPMDQWVMKTAMQQYSKWYKQGLKPGVLALNLSMRQLRKEGFVESIEKLLEETGCKTQWLELEVTEGQIMQDANTAIEVLNRIKALGISLAIDDFGTGYSSLSQLKRLPINKLKIDRSFVRDLPDDEEDVVISKTIIALSKNMGLSVIAEGVETEKQKDFLLNNGCQFIQGYYYSRPVLAQEVEESFL